MIVKRLVSTRSELRPRRCNPDRKNKQLLSETRYQVDLRINITLFDTIVYKPTCNSAKRAIRGRAVIQSWHAVG